MSDGRVGSAAHNRRQDALTAISVERDRQDSLWPAQAPGGTQSDLDTAPDTMTRLMASLGGAAKASNDRGESNILTVLIEEVGEVAEAVIEGKHLHLHIELVHTAAVCVKWIETLACAEDEPRGKVATARHAEDACMANIHPTAGGDIALEFVALRYCWLPKGHGGPHRTLTGIEVPEGRFIP